MSNSLFTVQRGKIDANVRKGRFTLAVLDIFLFGIRHGPKLSFISAILG